MKALTDPNVNPDNKQVFVYAEEGFGRQARQHVEDYGGWAYEGPYRGDDYNRILDDLENLP